MKENNYNPDYCTQQGSHSEMKENSKAFGSVAQSVWLFATPRITAHQFSLSITNSQRLLKLMLIESVMPSSYLILCFPLLLLLPIPPSIRIFSNESTLRMRWPKYRSFSFSISPSNEYPWLISFRMLYRQAKAERIQENQTSSSTNAKGSSLDRKHRKVV